MNAILDNTFTLPEIPENQILELDVNNKETLILQIPIVSQNGIIKYLYLKPPSYLQHIKFTQEYGKATVDLMYRNGLIGKNDKEFDIKISLHELIGLMSADFSAFANILKKYMGHKDYGIVLQVLNNRGGQHWIAGVGQSVKGWAAHDPWDGGMLWEAPIPYDRITGWTLLARK